MNTTFLSVLSAMSAAAWSVWTWQSERQKDRDIKRNEMSAQYVNNLIVITQELQRLLFKILQEDEFAHYRSKDGQPVEPASPIAIEFLYILSVFFGWENMTIRFGPYTRDSRMIAMMAQISELLESRSLFPGDAFRFSLSERHALGMAVMRRVGETSSGPAFVVITRFKFEEEMLNEASEWARLFASQEVRGALSAIDRAVAGEPLEGRERLAALQNLLVNLVSYLEHQEGFRVSFGERKRVATKQEQAGSSSQDSKDVRILHQMPGRIRLGIPRLHDDSAYALQLQALLQKLNHVNNFRVNVYAASIVLEYSADQVPLAEFIETVVTTIESLAGAPSGTDNVRPAKQLVAGRK